MLVYKSKEIIRPTEKTLGRKDLKYYFDDNVNIKEHKHMIYCGKPITKTENIFISVWTSLENLKTFSSSCDKAKKFVLLTYRIRFSVN